MSDPFGTDWFLKAVAANRASVAKAAVVAAPSQPVRFRTIKSAANKLGILTLIGASCGVDRDNEFLAPGDMIKAAFDFTAGARRTIKANHKAEVGADVVESFVGCPVLKSGRIVRAGETLPPDSEDPIVDAVASLSNKSGAGFWFV